MKTTYSLRSKLYLLAGVLIIFIAILGGFSYWSETRITAAYSRISDFNFPNTKSMYSAISKMRVARIELLQIALAPNTEKDATSIKLIKSSWEGFDQDIKEYLEQPFEPGEEEIFNKWMDQIKALRKGFEDVGVLADNPAPIDSAKRKQIAELVLGPHVDISPKLRDTFSEAIIFQTNAVNKSKEIAISSAKTGLMINLLLICFSLVFGIFFTYFLAKNLVSVFLGLSEKLDDSSSHVSSASQQIAAASQQLSQATTEQAAALQQTSAAIEEMSSMVTKSSENAKSAASVSINSKNNAERGQNVVSEMIQSMTDIDQSNKNIMEQIEHSNNEISTIVKVIEEIGNKTKVINEIVFQTKLLSFNASVEAARAGEHGKGFAVVAEEVGSLAEMSGNAAKEITSLLEGSIQRVEGIVNDTKTKVERLVQDGKSKVEAGTNVANQCAEVLSEIVQNVSAVAQMAEEISSASHEQAQGVAEITKAMQQLDQMTQQNASTSEESANAAEELSAQAQSLKGFVMTLVENVEGSAAAAEAKHSHQSTRTVKSSYATKSADDSTSAKSNQKNKSATSKTEKNNTPAKSNVIAMKTKKTKEVDNFAPAHLTPKSAVGDGSVPSHTSPGFKDV